MKRSIGIMAIAAVLLIITVSFVGAGEAWPIVPKNPPLSTEGTFEAENISGWFIEFDSPPTVDGTSLATLAAEKAAFEEEAGRVGLDYTERFTFTTLWNGMSLTLDPGDLNKLETLGSVKAVYPVVEVQRPRTFPGNAPEMAHALSMTGADIVQSELGFTGAGVNIAIMDSGIDYDHPDLGGCFGPGCKVHTGWDFVGDAYDYGLVPVPDPDPDDCMGHGTHVAGIAAADGDVVGVAPGAGLGAYRVFGCAGSTDSDIMLAAMEMILADGMDVLNMSIGSAFWGWPQYPTAQGATKLVQQGVVVVASAGNEGDYGLYAVGAPSTGRDVISVASFDNVMTTSAAAVVDGFVQQAPNAPDLVPPFVVLYNTMSYSGAPPTSGTEPIDYVGRGCNIDPPITGVAGQLALIQRGECSFNEKATNAINAGATGVVIFNNVPGSFGGTLGSPIDGVTPVVSISQQAGQNIALLIDATWRWTDNLVSYPNPTGGLISDFSSYGLAPDLSIKPDIGAPGGNIWSTVPVEQGSYASKSGTSMASPHVAGAAALMLEAHPSIPSEYMRALLQNTADPQPWNLSPTSGFADHVYRQGAGMLDIDDAILGFDDVVVIPGKIAAGEGDAGPSTHTLLIYNRMGYWRDFELDWFSTIATNGIIDLEMFGTTDEDISFSRNPVSVPPYGAMPVNVTITPPVWEVIPWNALYNGWLEVREVGMEEPVYRVPYAGFMGDFQDIDHLNNPYGLPWLTYFDGWSWWGISEGHVFTMEPGNTPWLLYHLDHQTPQFVVEILNGMTGRRAYPVFYKIFDWDFHGRSSTTGSFWADPWDGTRILWNRNVEVPDGSYQMRVRVLKANGNPFDPADWETWTSPMFYIDRPD